MDNVAHTQNCIIQAVNDPEAESRGIGWDVLRIDQVHPVVSGNKWFKLQPYLERARAGGYRGLLSFGGAWSNHLHALAFAARAAGISSLGLVRGEAPAAWSETLQDARDMGMELVFLPRKPYALLSKMAGPVPGAMPESLVQEVLAAQASTASGRSFSPGEYLLVSEGGYGIPGMEGAAGIWSLIPPGTYTHVLCAVGTGTMMAGLLLGSTKDAGLAQQGSGPYQTQAEGSDRQPGAAGPVPGIIGIPVLRNASSLEAEIRALLPRELQETPIHLDHRFHGGGYAKTSPEQLAFMASFHARTGIPTDIIYTSKLMRAVWTMIREGYFPPHSRILAIHSGGLQGNRSLKMGILPF